MVKYIFHMANGKTQTKEANTLEEAMEALGLTTKVPIGTRDGKATTIVLIEVRSKGIEWTPPSEPEK